MITDEDIDKLFENLGSPCGKSSGSEKYPEIIMPPVRFTGSPNGGEQYKRLVEASPIKCECGAEKAGSAFHSNWCPKNGN